MFAHNPIIDASAPVDVQPVSDEQDGLTAQALRLVRSAPLTGMRRAQLVYELRAQMGVAGSHVGTNDLLKFVDEVIRRETTVQDGFSVDRDGLIAQASHRACSVPPTGIRTADQIVQGHIRLGTSSDGAARALGELLAAADELARCSRQFSKLLHELIAQLPYASPGEEEVER